MQYIPVSQLVVDRVGEQVERFKQNDKFKGLRRLLRVYSVFGVLLLLLGGLLIISPSLPAIWYSINHGATSDEINSLTTVVEAAESNEPDTQSDVIVSRDDRFNDNGVMLPEYDASLTETNTLRINKIGVDAPIIEHPNGETGLEDGVWRTHNWGTPEDPYAMILAAHRFGYVYWSSEFRREQSFYNLPKLEVGDEIEVIWNQRKYTYKVYKSEKSTEITDYEADVILYTCELFNSPVRIFKYLERVQ